MQQNYTADYDPLTPLIRLRTSNILETLVSLQSVVHPWHHRDWTEEARSVLGPDFVSQLAGIYNAHHLGCDFTELSFAYANYDDVDGFLRYIEKMPLPDFMFYVLGRIFPRSVIPDTINAGNLQMMFEEQSENVLPNYAGMDLSWTDRAEELKSTLHGLWSRYWEKFLSTRIGKCEAPWTESLREKEEIISKKGGTALLEDITGYKKLPPPIPEDMPYSEITVVPIYRIPRHHSMFYGYGNVTLLYDCRRTKAYERELEQEKDRTLRVLKALSDENRMKILRLIADVEHTVNGKAIAEKVGLSPSVVSRHLSQLRNAGIISERSEDNRNITYTMNEEVISSIPSSLLKYLNE
jgi:DNA-binding transcriptional ArsR family regulator